MSLPSIQPGDRFVPSPWRGVLDLYVIVAMFCALAAAIVTLASPSFPGFVRWLFITESIGIVSVTIGASLTRWRRLRRYTPRTAHLIVGGIAIPVGYVLGSSFAYWALGEPLPILQPEPRRVIALLASGLAATFLVYLDAMRQRVENEAAARMEAQRLASESQLRLLRAQLEPHMLFNTLANVRSLVDIDPKLAQTMIDQVIVYLRSALTASREESVTLRHELAQLRAYLEIMALRMGPRMRFEIDLPEELSSFAVPPMLLQPLVENAIKHGIEPKIGASEIKVLARRHEGSVEIAILDTGLGLGALELAPEAPSAESPRAEPRGTSYGLVHVRARLRAFYGPSASLTIERNEPHGVRATVRIPQ